MPAGAIDTAFRFAVGQPVQVCTHPARPLGTIVGRWPGAAFGDPYGENIYQVSSFVTKQRESSLAAAEGRHARFRRSDADFGLQISD
jgi:hypothetical protein